jgi:hypothetical protein
MAYVAVSNVTKATQPRGAGRPRRAETGTIEVEPRLYHASERANPDRCGDGKRRYATRRSAFSLNVSSTGAARADPATRRRRLDIRPRLEVHLDHAVRPADSRLRSIRAIASSSLRRSLRMP